MAPMQRTNPAGVDLIKSFEKCVLRAYQDEGGVWTIGWGHTGKDVTEGEWWSQEMADQTLLDDLGVAERAVSSCVHRELNANQFSALVSFVFNEGSGTFFSSSILVQLNLGDFDAACESIGLYNKIHVNGIKRFDPGLADRRAAEQDLFRQPLPILA